MDTGGVNTGWDPANGFHIGSDDGNFYMHPWLLFQFRGVVNYRASVSPTDEGIVGQKGSIWQTGFEMRRAEVGLEGHLWSPDFKYYIMFNTADNTGTPGLDDAYVTDRLGDSPWIFKAGQFVDPVWHEANVSDGNQLAAERSLANAFLGGGDVPAGIGFDEERVQGVGIRYEHTWLHAETDLHDGYASANTTFIDTATQRTAPKPENFGWSGRIEAKVAGDDSAWNEYDQFSALGDTQDLLVFGTGWDWTQGGDEDNWFYTFDAQWDTASGIDAYTAVYGNTDSIPTPVAAGGGFPAVPRGHFLNAGWIIQGGYLVTRQWEPFIRYDLTHIDGNLSPNEHTINVITLGVNYYLYGQRAKVTLDGSYLPTGPAQDATGLDILSDQRKSEINARLQFQLEI
jgi:hypothetical protein